MLTTRDTNPSRRRFIYQKNRRCSETTVTSEGTNGGRLYGISGYLLMDIQGGKWKGRNIKRFLTSWYSELYIHINTHIHIF